MNVALEGWVPDPVRPGYLRHADHQGTLRTPDGSWWDAAAIDSQPSSEPSGNGQLHTPQEPGATVQPHSEDVPDLAREQDILARFLVDAHLAGVVGEDTLIATEYLAITSRLLDQPVSLVVKGASSSGKSFSTETTCRFFPSKAVLPFTGMSEKALLLSKQSYEHRTLVIYEASALRERAEKQSGDQTAYYVRSLLSEGCTYYEMAVKDKDGGWTSKRFEKRGPTNAIITTTSVALHNENETRMLSIPTNDSPAQTRSVLRALAEEQDYPIELRRWHALQDWLWQQDNRVRIPFAGFLAENIPPVAVRLRRDFRAILSLTKAHALLHQATRERDDQGRIIATPGDYAAVRALVLDVVSEGIGATVSTTIRETVAEVSSATEISASDLGRKLGIDKSAAYRRLQVAIQAGYVVNNEERRGRQGRYAIGEPLPDDLVILPTLPDHEETAGQDDGCTVAAVSRGVA